MATLVERWLEQGREEERRHGLLSTIQMGLDIKFGDEGWSRAGMPVEVVPRNPKNSGNARITGHS